MRKTKYFIMGFIFLLFLNSCGYLQYAYEQAVVAAGGTPSTYTDGDADSYRKDGPQAIYNPKYKQKIELLLQDIVNRGLTEKNIYYVDGKEITLWLPEGVVIGKYTQTLKDKKTGYGLPFSINYERECPDQIITNVAKEYDGLKVVSDSKDYIYIYSFYSEERFKNAKEILKLKMDLRIIVRTIKLNKLFEIKWILY